MKGALHVARREWLEQRRHPVMFAICATLLGGIALLCVGLMGMLAVLEGLPDATANVGRLTTLDPDRVVSESQAFVVLAFDFLIFSQYLGFVGVVAGHGLLHDRSTGTLPFLLLAPISRTALLLGKVLGAWAPLTVLFWAITIPAGGGILWLAPSSAGTPARPAWWIAVLAGGPMWAVAVAVVGVTISGLARDVRLAQQGVWFAVFFIQMAVALLITGALGSVSGQLAAVGLGAVFAAVGGGIAVSLLERDLER